MQDNGFFLIVIYYFQSANIDCMEFAVGLILLFLKANYWTYILHNFSPKDN
jgi:hypothetical protein